MGPPGDACVDWGMTAPEWFILDGDAIRYDPPPDCPSETALQCYRLRGRVLDNGTRIEFTQERVEANISYEWRFRKIR